MMMKNSSNLAQTYQSATQMNAIGMTDFPTIGKVVDGLKMIDVPVPRPQAGEVAIKMMASSLYADELYAAQGTALGRFFGPKVVSETEPYIMGSSVAGIIVDVGENVTNWAVGQEIIAIPSQTPVHGVWAEYCCLNQDRLMPKPDGFSFVEAAGIKMAACVSWGAICYGRIKPNNRTLVIGASGGLGIMAVQYLKTLGAHVTGVCSGKNAEMVRAYGADEVVDYTQHNFADLAIQSQQFYDAVFDFVGGIDNEKAGFRALKKSGSYITVTGPVRFIGEKQLSWFELGKVFFHVASKSVLGRISGPRYIFGEMKPAKTVHDALTHAVKHQIKMPISQEIPFELDAVKQALSLILSHRAKGRMVIDFGNV
ncbi:MAG: NAD(P)-dependent alcohol dehydrogenase [Chloroflexi bacterium]|nr:MAG: NAD(P)-dependent alcohol dehydrogenase [Chloroflexota bacterium]